MQREEWASLVPRYREGTEGKPWGKRGAWLCLLQENGGRGATKDFGSAAWTSGYTQTGAFEHGYG